MIRTTTILTVMFAVVFAAGAVASGQDAASWLNPRFGNLESEVTYTFRGYGDRDVSGQGRELGLMRHRVALQVPISQDQTHEWLMTLSYGGWDIDTAATFPDTGGRFPSCLHDVELGVAYRQKLENGWIWGGGAWVGSPADRPFHSGEEVSVAARGFLRIPHGKRNAFLAFLDFSNTRSFAAAIPLPGVAYNWVPTDDLNLVLGVPMSSIRWRPLDKLTLSARYILPRNVHARIGYQVMDSCEVYGLFAWDNEQFFRHDRPDDDDRLLFYEKRVGGGIKIDLAENVTLDISTGWAFDGFFFEGEDYGDRSDNRLTLEDGLYAGVSLSVRF
ncbi:MAG: hypothetical protein KGY99_10355 [Phycisphaerae bacterium]|nr:hypothetical protein [Phycisphaerae bacterium]